MRYIKKTSAYFILKALLLFLYVFNLKFLVFEAVSSLRVVFLLVLAMFAIRAKNLILADFKKEKFFYLVLVGLILWAIITLSYQTEPSGLLNAMVVFTIFSLLGGALFSFLFEDEGEFLRAFFWVVLVQSVFVYLSFFIDSFRLTVASLLVQTGNIPLEYGKRVAGFSTSSGSALSYVIALGVISALYMASVTSRLGLKLRYYLAALFMTSACIFVGKLGLFVGLTALVGALLVEAVKWVTSIRFFVLSCFVSLTFLGFAAFGQGGLFWSLDLGDAELLSYAISRSFSIFIAGEDSTLTALLEMPFPPLNTDTFIGWGGIADANGINVTGSDIGYVQIYYSAGLFFCVLFYVGLFAYFVRSAFYLASGPLRLVMLALIAILFLAELKEPFVFKVVYCFHLFVLVFILKRRATIGDAEMACVAPERV